MYSKDGSIWDDGTVEERIAETRNFIAKMRVHHARERMFERRLCTRGDLCLHAVQCPGTTRT